MVESTEGDRLVSDVTPQALLTSSDPGVVRVEGGMLVPAGNGAAVIEARHEGHTASAAVTVTGMDQPHVWSFRNHVQSVLAKKGCNAGACHGALAGKGGFKLSLRGYDTMRDFETITRQARGRRIELADPGRSLILAKPSGAIPHKGGLRFDVDSLEYRVLSEWIAAGALPPREDDPRLDHLEILPHRAVLAKDAQQQIVVRAHFADGRVEDVTQWAKFTSTDETVAQVDEAGKVTVTSYGEGAVTAWYASNIAVARIASPYPHQIDPAVFASAPRRNFIDELVLDKLQSLNLRPSPAASDAEFLRRAYLDTIGTLPSVDEARRFLADTSPDKRDRLIDELLARPEFVDYWSYKWSDLLLVSGNKLRPDALKAYYRWIRESVESDKPWDEFAREIVTATGSSYENGATNFFALHQDPQEMTENVSMAFMGLSIGCAKCHNHPLEKWTNDQYYAMANLFARVRAKGWGGDFRAGDGRRTVYVASKGDLIQPLRGKPQPPAPLDGEPIPFDATGDRRTHLADWLTSPENPYFSRAITNRIWANFMGVGLVEAVDDMRESNPPSNEELLDAAAQFLVENQYQLKPLMRAILQSAAYQRSSKPLPENKDEHRYYSRNYPKRLMAEVMLDAISQVTQARTTFAGYDEGTRALELPDSSVDSYFLKTFGRAEREITCECERSSEPSMVQVLHISNGDTINQKLHAEKNRLEQLLGADVSGEQIIEEAYLAALSRYPTDTEREQLLALMRQDDGVERRVLVEDLFWSVLSSKEFLFNH
ncbi:MAG: DUF1549 domain-containing protein [Pirellulales bacterium]